MPLEAAQNNDGRSQAAAQKTEGVGEHARSEIPSLPAEAGSR